MCWKRLLKVPWTARRSNQSTLRDINPEFSLEGLMLKLKLQYFGHLLRIANSLEKSLMMGKIERRRIRGCQRMKWLDGINNAMDKNLGNLQEMVRDREAWQTVVLGIAKSQTRLGDWDKSIMNLCQKDMCESIILSFYRCYKLWLHKHCICRWFPKKKRGFGGDGLV